MNPMRSLSLNGADALLMIGDSERNCDLFWATGFRAPDPFVYVMAKDGAFVAVKDLELDRARQQVRNADVVAISTYEKRVGDSPPAGAVLAELLRHHGLQRLLVPDDFPLGTADRLRQAGFELQLAPAPLFPQRAVKREDEIEAIASAQQAAEAGMRAAFDAIGNASIEGAELRLDGAPLTSEAVRQRIHRALLEHDCIARHTIVAGGEQAIDPHQDGHGPLPAHQPIIIDIFPQHSSTGYFGDLTRTVVRGTITDAVQRLYDTVAAAQALVLQGLGPGADGHTLHTRVVDHFENAGYETGQSDGRMQGYFHSTGHGVGLEIHEAPSLSRRNCVLEPGHVLTVERGLYYLGIGGVRIEDLVVVDAEGCRNLTTLPKVLAL